MYNVRDFGRDPERMERVFIMKRKICLFVIATLALSMLSGCDDSEKESYESINSSPATIDSYIETDYLS